MLSYLVEHCLDVNCLNFLPFHIQSDTYNMIMVTYMNQNNLKGCSHIVQPMLYAHSLYLKAFMAIEPLKVA
jgi:hypothetical protein